MKKYTLATPLMLCLVFAVQVQAQICPRETAVNDYNNLYLSSRFSSSEIQWTGNTEDCEPGTISQTVLNDNLQRIRYFRKLVGGLTTSLSFDADLNSKCQEGVLMLEANPSYFDHCFNPNECVDLDCNTANGVEALQNSNIGQSSGWGFSRHPIDQWIEDRFVTNLSHRREILSPYLQDMGLGLTSDLSVLWFEPQSPSSPVYNQFIAYPNGYTPRNLVYSVWSFSIPGANFSNANVSIVDADNNNYSSTLFLKENGGPNPMLSWQPSGINTFSDVDIKYTVTVSGISGAPSSSYTYDVWVINPVYPPICPDGAQWSEANCECRKDCAISAIELVSSECNNDGTFDAEVKITYENPPITGFLEVFWCAGLVCDAIFPSIGTSPQTITVSGIPANGETISISANFSANTNCELAVNNIGVAPDNCGSSCNNPPPATGTIPDGTYQTSAAMTTAGQVNAPDNVVLKSGTSISLTNGFHAKPNATFRALIEACAEAATEGPIVAEERMASPAAEFQSITKKDQLTVYPNPFNTQTTIAYKLNAPQTVSVEVYNMNGQRIAQLVPGAFQEAGEYQVPFYAMEHPPGVYLVFLKTAENMISKRMLLAR